MAFRRTLQAPRLFNASKNSITILKDCRISTSASAVQSLIPAKAAPDPGDDGFYRRFLQRRPLYQSATPEPVLSSLPRGEKLLEKLRRLDIARDRIRLDGLIPPQLVESDTTTNEEKLTVEDARRFLRLSQLENLKLNLRQINKDNIPFREFLQICSKGCSNAEQGLELAKILDESGTVIVLGNVVFLRPEQVVKVFQDLMPIPVVAHQAGDPIILKELEEMEKQKCAIDKEAVSLVRRELWVGLGYLVIQTAAFMRLTFWELSWDVMEPICFYVTSMYFMAGYAFFLRTSKEPSFEGFFQSRFGTKQRRLMEKNNFDVGRYSELRRACYPYHTSSSSSPAAFGHDPSPASYSNII